MASTSSSTPSLTPSRSPTPQPPVQPDHFYGNDSVHLPPSPNSDGRTWLDPEDDPLAQRGIPVFKPTMEEFSDFEAYLNRIEAWGMKSGIVKVIPPKEWNDSLPALNPQLANVKLKNPIEQEMMGRAGLFRQQNIERRRFMSVREWAELCAKEEMRAPCVDEIDIHARATNGTARTRTRRGGRTKTRDPETAEPELSPDVMVKEEQEDQDHVGVSIARVTRDDTAGKTLAASPSSPTTPAAPIADNVQDNDADLAASDGQSTDVDHRQSEAPCIAPSALQTPSLDDTKDHDGAEEKPKLRGRRSGNTRAAREAALAERAAKDELFLQSFKPHEDWLPQKTKAEDYTVEFCKELERRYWRYCGLGKPAWYGADMAGSLFTDDTTSWNVAHLPSALSRLLPSSEKGLPGVNTPYLYFGMWRATFAWHVEDMDLFSINYIHFGAPKFWYAVPQGRASALEQTMRGYFPKDTSNCSQFLRHKSYLASPNLLAQSSCRPNTLVQRSGEFVITFPRGYHAGFNLGFNCAESVNFALDSWLDLGRVAKACTCVDFSVRIDVDQLLLDREAERAEQAKTAHAKRPRKRKSESGDEPTAKKPKSRPNRLEVVVPLPPSPSKLPKVTLKLGPKPKDPDTFPCCLCISSSRDGLLRVLEPPIWLGDVTSADGPGVWMAHEECANVVPEAWVDEVEIETATPDGTMAKEKVVMGVDAIVKDRWNLKCTACTKTRQKAHGAPIQCTKGKCPKAFHVSCARDGTSQNIVYTVLREVEKEVVLIDPRLPAQVATPVPVDPAAPTGMASEGAQMDIDQTQTPEPQVLKLIKKLEVQVLCQQHNPAIAEAKKAAKQDRIRDNLLALPPTARIKLRVSAGVFEVSLVRVVEETKSVEVIWDRGMKREFKWGSVVFGNTEAVVGQKPTEVAPEPAPTMSMTQTSAVPYPLPQGLASASYAPQQPYGHAQPVASTSYQPAPSTSGYNQHYQSPYHQPYQQSHYHQTQAPSQYGAAVWQYQYSSYPPPSTNTTLYGQSQSGQPHYNPPPQNAPGPYGNGNVTSQRPAYTSMSYQPYNGYNFGSGVSSYPQLSETQTTSSTAYHPPPPPPNASTPIPGSPSTPQPASSTVPDPSLLPLPTQTHPSVSATQTQLTPQQSGTHLSPSPPPPPSPASSIPQPSRPARIIAPPTKYTPPAVPVTTQFHITTPASFVASELRWQQPYTGPKGLSPAPVS